MPAWWKRRSGRPVESTAATTSASSERVENPAPPAAETGAVPNAAVPHGHRPPRVESLWIWPAIVIVLIAGFGAVFGPGTALLIAGQAAAVLAFAVAVRLRSPQWLAAVIALALSSAVVLGGLSQMRWPSPATSPRTAVSATPATTGEPEIGTADLRSRNLTQQAVRSIDFRRVELAGAHLDGLDLRGRNFDGAHASGASFRGSRLDGASLRGAVLRDACLRGARLPGADLTGADLSGADMAGAELPADAPEVAGAWPGDAASSTACH